MDEILTIEEIEKIARVLPTSRKRINARIRLKKSTNNAVDEKVAEVKSKIRALISRPECEKRDLYTVVSLLESRRL